MLVPFLYDVLIYVEMLAVKLGPFYLGDQEERVLMNQQVMPGLVGIEGKLGLVALDLQGSLTCP